MNNQEKLPSSHLSLTESSEVETTKTIEKAVAELDMQDFVHFANELQYALKYWSNGYQMAQSHLAGSDGEHQKKEAHLFASQGRDKVNTLSQSTLYEAIRTRLRTEFEMTTLPKDWSGWLGLETDQDMQKINSAIDTIFRGKFPIPGLVFGKVSPEKVTEAQETIQSYGISGIFIENPTEENLLAAYSAHFGQ